MPKFQPVICCRNERPSEGKFGEYLRQFLETLAARNDCTAPIVVSNDPAFQSGEATHIALKGSSFLEQMATGQEVAENASPYDNVVMVDFINLESDGLFDDLVRKAMPGLHRGYVVLLRKKGIKPGKHTMTMGELTNVETVDPFSFEGIVAFTHDTMREHLASRRYTEPKTTFEHLFVPIQGIAHQCLAA
jgi:hypothetical protein